ncbi:MAG: phage tail protein [Oscillospiraceae bacterium]|nr:phage tail protein [Oscillospiraceae bacterium]
MINISDALAFLDILPRSIVDEEMTALAKAIDPEIRSIELAIGDISFMSKIDELPEALIINLARQFNVNLHEHLNPTLEQKRAIVKYALLWHRRRGTPAALEEMIAIFFPNSRVEEWFEYGGEPYFFRVILYSDDLSEENLNNVRITILEEKNVRSWFEDIRAVPSIKDFINRNQFVFVNLGVDLSFPNITYPILPNRPPPPRWNGVVQWNGQRQWGEREIWLREKIHHRIFMPDVRFSPKTFENGSDYGLKDLTVHLSALTKQPPMEIVQSRDIVFDGSISFDGTHTWRGSTMEEI